MANKTVRIILDTNLWLSFLINKGHSKLTALLLTHKYELVFSQELMDEFIEVAARSKFKKYFRPSDLHELIRSIEPYATYVEVSSDVDLCRDRKDNFLLNLSIDGNVAFLITGDKDLLELKRVGKTQIITLTEFLNG